MNKKFIVDLGLHLGQDTAFYLKKGFNVVAVEANPALAGAARRRFRKFIAKGRLVIINKGIARNSGELTFYVNKTNSSWSSFVKEIGARGGEFETVKVETITLPSLLSEYGMPYYLKVDIEGYDEIAVASLADFRVRPKFVSLENGYPRALKLLVSLGYDRFKFINQAEVMRQTLPFPPREGRFALHRFEYESSGAFGDEAPGGWLDESQALSVIEAFWATPNFDAAVHGWCDLHARLSDNFPRGAV